MISELTPGISDGVHANRSTFFLSVACIISTSGAAMAVSTAVLRSSSKMGTHLSSSLASSQSLVARRSRSINTTVGSTDIGGASRNERSFREDFLLGERSFLKGSTWGFRHSILLPPSGRLGLWEYPSLVKGTSSPGAMLIWSGRSSEEDVIRGIGINYQIPNLYRLATFLLTEGGVELDVALGSHPLARETDHVVVIRHHLGLGYSHSLERFPVDDVYWAFLINKSFLW